MVTTQSENSWNTNVYNKLELDKQIVSANIIFNSAIHINKRLMRLLFPLLPKIFYCVFHIHTFNGDNNDIIAMIVKFNFGIKHPYNTGLFLDNTTYFTVL